MADLIVLGFEDLATAQEVFELGSQMQREELIDLEDAALAWRDESGRVRIQQAMSTTAAGAAGGGLWGTLIGLLFLNPLAGAVVGAAGGAVAGALSNIGISDELISRSRSSSNQAGPPSLPWSAARLPIGSPRLSGSTSPRCSTPT